MKKREPQIGDTIRSLSTGNYTKIVKIDFDDSDRRLWGYWVTTLEKVNKSPFPMMQYTKMEVEIIKPRENNNKEAIEIINRVLK